MSLWHQHKPHTLLMQPQGPPEFQAPSPKEVRDRHAYLMYISDYPVLFSYNFKVSATFQ